MENNDTTIETIFGTLSDVHHDYHFLKFHGEPQGRKHKHWSVAASETGSDVSITFGNQHLTIEKVDVPGLLFALEKVGLYKRPSTRGRIGEEHVFANKDAARRYARDAQGQFTSTG